MMMEGDHQRWQIAYLTFEKAHFIPGNPDCIILPLLPLISAIPAIVMYPGLGFCREVR